jgi:hypothetical protein
MCVLSVQCILVGIDYILIGIPHFDYLCLLFVLLVLSGFLIILILLKAVPMYVFLNNYAIVRISGP